MDRVGVDFGDGDIDAQLLDRSQMKEFAGIVGPEPASMRSPMSVLRAVMTPSKGAMMRS